MDTEGVKLFCKACGASWEMDKFGRLQGGSAAGARETRIPDWYEWERGENDFKVRY